jgi:hypothetical protein
MLKSRWQGFSVVVMVATGWTVANAQNVKVTPIGQRTGEFCAQDRAILFEDPTGVRILDAGNTIAGATDPRLGNVNAILVSHAHSDHLGNAKLNQNPDSDSASCGNADTSNAPSTNTAEIAAGKNAAVIAGGPLSFVIGRLIAAVVDPGLAGRHLRSAGGWLVLPPAAQPVRCSLRGLYDILSEPTPPPAAMGHLTLYVAVPQLNRVPRGWRRLLPANPSDQPYRTPSRSI